MDTCPVCGKEITKYLHIPCIPVKSLQECKVCHEKIVKGNWYPCYNNMGKGFSSSCPHQDLNYGVV